MSQDCKCFLGVHKYEIVDNYEVKNPYGVVIGTTIVSRCINCGKIKEKFVPTNKSVY